MFEQGWWEVGTLGAGVVLTCLLLAVGHWFPWVGRLSRIGAYVYGVMAILAGFGGWRLLNGDWVSVVGLVVIVVAGGATVVGAYWVDGAVLALRQARKVEATDDELGSIEG